MTPDLTDDGDAGWLRQWRVALHDSEPGVLPDGRAAIEAATPHTALIEHLHRDPDTVVGKETPPPPNAHDLADALDAATALDADQLAIVDHHPDIDRISTAHPHVRTAIRHLKTTPPVEWSEADRHIAQTAAAFAASMPDQDNTAARPAHQTGLTRYDALRLTYARNPVTLPPEIVLEQARSTRD